jgi:NADH:ubiquinone oxidoreductase subunit 2 (subunit N)
MLRIENIVFVSAGVIFVIAGIGFAIAKSDAEAKEKDEKRFGPLNIFNMGGWYLLMQNNILKYVFIAIFLITGFIFIIYGLKQ